MNNQNLRQELDRVTLRYRQLVISGGLAVGWLVLALIGVTVLVWMHWGAGKSVAIPAAIIGGLLLIPIIMIPLLRARLRTSRDPLWMAHRIEKQFPDLDTRLLAAVEQQSKGEELGFLQQVVIEEAVSHSKKSGWEKVIPTGKLRTAQTAQWAMLVAVGAVVAGLVQYLHFPSSTVAPAIGTVVPHDSFEIRIVPEDTSIERGTGLLVTATFGTTQLPADVQLLYKEGDGAAQQMPMSKSLDDPLFAGRVPSVKKDLSYAVRYGDAQTRWFKATVFDYPALNQADAKLQYPQYTGLPEKTIQDTRSVTAIEGTKATFTFHLNKPVADARLVPVVKPAATLPAGAATQPDLLAAGPGTQPAATAPAAGAPVVLTVDPTDPTVYTANFDLRESQAFHLQLVDADKRANRDPASVVINVTPNKPPDLKMVSPGHDVDVSPIEELTVKASVWQEFGVKRVGLSYSLAGQPEQDVVLGENISGKDRKEISDVISLEKLAAQPDQLLSYHLWAEDTGPDGKVRRTLGDMYFAEVRPFEQIFRQGQQPAGGEEQQRQQQQQQQAGGGNAQRADQLADSEKEIIAATWKVIRRETGDKPTDLLAPDAKVIDDAQAAAKEKAAAMGDRVTDEKSQALLDNVLKDMDQASTQLKTAESGPVAKPLPDALASEQSAYQDLLKMRAREFDVTRQNRQQGQQGQSSAAQRQQQQLQQLQMDNQENRYETQRSAAAQQQQQTQQDAAQRETRQVLSRLRELAQRQTDLNRQIREAQAALEKATDQAQKDDLQRQLARLRDQQEQMLRDTDELRDRMAQPENQERMADSRQQLDQTRNNEQRASDALNRGQTQEAAAAGQRAAEQLNKLQDQVRQTAAGQFNDAMTQMREDARTLDQNQQALSQRLANMDQPATQPQVQIGLRPATQPALSQERQQVAQGLDQQKQDLQKLLDNMKTTIQQAETPEPLLSRQLYDTLRQARLQQPDQALDTSRQLVQQGLVPQARQTEGEAGKGISQLRQGIEQAATSVLGDETEALRRARDELDTLNQQLATETGAQGANQQGANPQNGNAQRAGQSATQPSAQGQNPSAPGSAGGPTTQPSLADAASATQPNGQNNQNGQLAQNSGSPNGPQPQGQQPGQQGQQAGQRNGQQANGQQQNGQPNSGERQLAGGPQGQQQNGQQQPGQQAGQQNGQQNGQQAGGQQRGQQAGGQQGERQLAAGPQGPQPNGQQGQPQAGDQQAGQQAGQQPGGQQPGQQGQQNGQQNGQQPDGQRGQQANGQGRGGQQPGQQPGQQANGQGRGQQPGDQNGQQPGQQSGQQGDQQANGQNGQRGGQGQQANGQRGGQRGQQANGQGRGGQQPGQQPGDQQANGQGRGQQPGDQNGQQPGQQPGQQGEQQANGQNGQRGGQGQQANGQRGGQRGQQANGQGRGQQPGQQPGDQQANGQGQGRSGQQPGQQPGDQAGQQPGQQPQDAQTADAQQPGQGRGQGRGQGQPGQARGGQGRGGQGRGGQPGEPQQANAQQPGQPGQQPGDQAGQPQDAQTADAQQPGQSQGAQGRGQGRAGQARGGQARGGQGRGGQPGQPQQANAQQPGQPGQQPGQGQPSQQPGQGQAGQGQPGQQPGQQANAQGQPGQQPGRGGGPGQQGGQAMTNATQPDLQTANAGQRPAPDPTQPGAELRPPTTQPLAQRFARPNEGNGSGGPELSKPITGEGFREWSDRMRDVEEMVGDAQMRAEAARIRERVAAARAAYKDTATPPDPKAVQENILTPLAELRDAVSQELLRRESTQARVPLDTEPVPPAYADEVRRYYERLGSGK